MTDQRRAKDFTADQWRWLRLLQDAPEVSATAFAIGFGICRSINGKTGFAYPGQATLAGWAKIKERQARGLIRRLEQLGFIRVESGGFQKPDRYWITFPDRQPNAALRPAPECRYEAAPERQSSDRVTGNPVPPNCSRELFEIEEPPTPPVHRRKDGDLYEAEFSRFWDAYPRKVGKKAAQVAYARARKAGASVELLMTAASAYAGERAGRDPTFTKHPATWLNGEHWADEPTSAWTQSSGQPRTRTAVDWALEGAEE